MGHAPGLRSTREVEAPTSRRAPREAGRDGEMGTGVAKEGGWLCRPDLVRVSWMKPPRGLGGAALRDLIFSVAALSHLTPT